MAMALANRRRSRSRPRVLHAHGEDGPEDPAAVHRERRQQIEGCEKDVGNHDPLEKRAARYT